MRIGAQAVLRTAAQDMGRARAERREREDVEEDILDQIEQWEFEKAVAEEELRQQRIREDEEWADWFYEEWF